ncbi:MAG: hypothetical protein VX471_02640 [Acidobacteriota bacterium]|jgi:hypothetical protein|nr:hypothetical protein [Acidobacteriota bacterium]
MGTTVLQETGRSAAPPPASARHDTLALGSSWEELELVTTAHRAVEEINANGRNCAIA